MESPPGRAVFFFSPFPPFFILPEDDADVTNAFPFSSPSPLGLIFFFSTMVHFPRRRTALFFFATKKSRAIFSISPHLI